MAKAIITLEDAEDGGILFEYNIDPPIPEDAQSLNDLTPAQVVLVMSISYMQQLMEFDQDSEVEN